MSKTQTYPLSVLVAPTYKGGLPALEDFLTKKIELRGVGKVIYRFTVTKNGQIKDVRALDKGGNVSEMEVLEILRTMPVWNPGKVKGKVEDYSYTLPLNFTQDKIKIAPELSNSILLHAKPLSSGLEPEQPLKVDSTIFKVFDRNKQWQKMLLVCDVTSSMSPYSAQVLLWLKSSFSGKGPTAEYLAFFNDGDKKADAEKVKGSTGGIYSGKASNFEEVKGLMYKAMLAGFGGDIPENNIEASLEALKQCTTCRDLVMIADNYATPRDLTLWNKLQVPVHIILCGSSEGVNEHYLNLALKTKGSVHTAETDFAFLSEPNEGKEIRIDKVTFVYLNGRFVRL